MRLHEYKTMKRRVVVVDKHPLLRRGLSELLNGEPDLEVSAATDMPDAALAAIDTSDPHLVMTSLSLSNGIDDGMALIADIRSQHADLPILVLSMHDGSRYAERAQQAGASAYLSKHESGETLLAVIRTLLDDKNVVGST